MSTRQVALGPSHQLLAHNQHHLVAWRWWLRLCQVLRVVGVAILVAAVASVLLQMVYPIDRALPFMRIGGVDVGGKQDAAIMSLLEDFARDGEVTLKTPSRSWQTKWQSIGLAVDREASSDAAVHYELWERFLPFSSVMHVIQARDAALIAVVDDDQLRAFAEKLVSEDKQAAREGMVVVTDGKVDINPAKNGYQYAVADVERQVRATPLKTEATVELVAKSVPAVRPPAELEAAAGEAQRILNKDMAIQIGDHTFRPSRQVRGAWLAVKEDPQTKKLAIGFNREKIGEYLSTVSQSVITKPGTITVTLLDGQEVGRTTAQAGQTVATETAFASIEQQLQGSGQQPTVRVPVVNVAPSVNYVRRYSQASSGLQALLQDWVQSNSGSYGIAVREVGGAQRYADYRPDKSFVAASTFKMFLAYDTLTKIEHGEIGFGTKTDLGKTVDTCMHEMILYSTNDCAISLFNLIGWQTSEDMVHSAGFTMTELNNRSGGDKYSTARDETNFLLRLHAGTLMNASSTNYLLDLMKRQIWRAGIPSGVPKGVVVADKVGFYNGYKHDVGIVYAPKGTYILTILSSGGSDAKLADLSKRVYNFFNQ